MRETPLTRTDNKPKKVMISVGPIPARLDSVKFITNRFKVHPPVSLYQ